LGLSLFDFLVSNLHEKKKSAAKNADGDIDLEEFMGPNTAPTDRVVCIHGFSFKAKERRTTTEKKEEYALGALLCFVPFSLDSFSADGLKIGYASYSEALEFAQSEEGLFSPRGVKYLQNVESWWANKFKAQRQSKRFRARQKAEAEGDTELQKAMEEHAAQRRMNPRGTYSDDEEMIGSDLGSDVDDDLIDFGDVTPAARTGWCKSPFLPFPTNSFN